jgi:hypothetical protein
MSFGGGGDGEVWFERRKWPDSPHYGHPAWLLGEDEFGVWYEVRAGLPWCRGSTVLFDGPFDAIVCVSDRGGYIAWFWTDIEHGELDLYVDVVTDVQRSHSSMTAIDLDLDVIRRRDDGAVELLDEDEFAEHQVELLYPASAIEHAETVARTVLDAVRRGAAPFDGTAAARWHAASSIN